jgi:hypothetical protein
MMIVDSKGRPTNVRAGDRIRFRISNGKVSIFRGRLVRQNNLHFCCAKAPTEFYPDAFCLSKIQMTYAVDGYVRMVAALLGLGFRYEGATKTFCTYRFVAR